MKLKTLFSAAVAFSIALSTSHAQLQWDADGITPVTGGTGTWNDTNLNWTPDNGASYVQWNDTTAIFPNAAGTVTVTGTQDATGLTFNNNAGGYTLTGGTINLIGTPAINTTVGQTTINSVVNGTNGFTYDDVNTLIFGGAGSTLTGTINQTNSAGGATIRVTQGTALGTANISMAQGTFQIVSGSPQTVANNISFAGNTNNSINAQGGNHTLTGTITQDPAGNAQLLYDVTAGATLTLSGNAGLGQTGATVQKTQPGTGTLIVNANGGSAASAFLLRAGTVQVNNVTNPFGVGGNVTMGGVAGQNPVLALNGANITGLTAVFIEAPASSREISNIAAGGSTVTNQIFFTGSTSLNLRSEANSALTVNLIRDADVTVTGAITIGTVGTPNPGTVVLNAASTYKGGTTVNGGTLQANAPVVGANSSTGTGAVAVDSGVLGGTGQIAPTGANGITVASGASIAPGAAGIGTLTVNLGSTAGEATMDDGSFFAFELGAAGASLADPGVSDLLSLTGSSPGDFNFAALGNTVNLTGGSLGYYKLFSTDLNNATLAGDSWDNLTYDPASGEVTSGLNAFNSIFIVGTASNAAGMADANNIGDIYVQIIPEPNTFLLLMAGFGLLGIARRKRKVA